MCLAARTRQIKAYGQYYIVEALRSIGFNFSKEQIIKSVNDVADIEGYNFTEYTIRSVGQIYSEDVKSYYDETQQCVVYESKEGRFASNMINQLIQHKVVKMCVLLYNITIKNEVFMEVKNKDGSYVDKDRVEALNYILSQLNKIPTIRSQKQYVNKLISTDFKHFIQFYK